MPALQKAKENPMITVAISISILVGGAIGVKQGWELVDELHTTQAELLLYDLKAHTFASQQFTGLEQKLIEIDTVSKCLWLKSEIRALSDSIYVRKRDGADPDYIHDLESDLEELEDDYAALECARKLA